MGGTASTRRVSVDNDDMTGVIKISDSVVHRIRNELQNQSAERPQKPAEPPKKEEPPKRPVAPPPPPPEPIITQQQAVQQQAPPAAAPVPPSRYHEDAYISLMKLREEKDVELRQMEQSWRTKINEMERRHAEQQGFTTEAFHKTLAEVQDLFLKASTTPICQDGQERVMKCYNENPKESLRCSQEVQQFSECVDLTRLNHLMR